MSDKIWCLLDRIKISNKSIGCQKCIILLGRMCARTWMKLVCIGCDSDKVCHSLDNIPICLNTLILNINCPLLCFSDDATFLPTVPVNDSSQSSIEVTQSSIHWDLTATESVVECLDMEPRVADNELTAINMKPNSNYSNSLGSELMSG